MSLSTYQMSYNGLTFGLGTAIAVEVISGLEDFETRTGDVTIPRAWGDIPGRHDVASKEVTLELSTTDDSAYQSMLTAFHPSTAEQARQLVFIEPHQPQALFLYARVIGRTAPKNPSTKFKKALSVRLRAADPRVYSVAQVQAVASVYTPNGGGLDYSTDYAKEFVGTGLTGEVIATNEGNSWAYPALIISGPQDGGSLTAATVKNMTNGVEVSFTFTNPLLASDVFTADMRRIVTATPGELPFIHLGGTNRYGNWDLPRQPFYLDAGDNIIRFTVTGTTTDATCALSYRHTSL